MARPDPMKNGTTETAREARGAENSKNSFGVLVTSMALALIAALLLFWYFGIFPFHHGATSPTG
jgi:hypothetical protein